MSLFDTGVRPAIDNWLLEKSKEKRNYGNYWSASSAGYCQRKVIFERLGVPHVEQEDDARKQRVFTAGHLFHAWAQNITNEAGISIASEVELQDEDLMVRGHFDDLVLIEEVDEDKRIKTRGLSPSEDISPSQIMLHEAKYGVPKKQRLILYDYKTRNSRNFDFSKKPSYFHRLQLGTYMYMLRNKSAAIFKINNTSLYQGLEEMLPDLTEARVLNIEKDTLRMSEVQYLWDTQLESDVLSYWNSLNTHWQAKTLPKCTCADHENGFMSRPKWNPYYYNDAPCSTDWYELCKKEGRLLK